MRVNCLWAHESKEPAHQLPCHKFKAAFAAQQLQSKGPKRRREKLEKLHNDCTKACALIVSSEPSEGSRGSQHGPSKVREFRRRTVPYLSHRNSRTHGSHNYHLHGDRGPFGAERSPSAWSLMIISVHKW